MSDAPIKTSQSRVFLIEDGAGPGHLPDYLGLARAGSIDWAQGTITPVRRPSPTRYGEFDVIDRIRGQRDLPTMPIEALKTFALSQLLRVVRKGCAVDLHVNFGECEDPQSFDKGWQVKTILEGALPSNYSTGDLGALDNDTDAPIRETVPFTGLQIYDVKHLRGSVQAATEITDPVVDVVICDSVTCGACGIASDGCQIAFALTGVTTASPGLPSELLYTQNGGQTWAATNITTLPLGVAGTRMACVGTNLVVISHGDDSLHYAPIVDILAGVETWTEVTTGIEAAGSPNDIFSLDSEHTWLVGDGGYVYFTADPTLGVSVQSAGGVTTENLTRVHAMDEEHIVAVGANNAIIASANGGAAFSLITGPTPGNDLTAIWMRSAEEWFVGADDGELYFTINEGAAWTVKAFAGHGAGVVYDIQFSTRNVGYMAHATATPRGRIFRTTNGGYTWVLMPEDTSLVMPANDAITTLAACRDDANVVFGGGIADDDADGFLIKFS
jgi:photosystem II stability/assembly factor-like uncharacterized protein